MEAQIPIETVQQYGCNGTLGAFSPLRLSLESAHCGEQGWSWLWDQGLGLSALFITHTWSFDKSFVQLVILSLSSLLFDKHLTCRHHPADCSSIGHMPGMYRPSKRKGILYFLRGSRSEQQRTPCPGNHGKRSQNGLSPAAHRPNRRSELDTIPSRSGLWRLYNEENSVLRQNLKEANLLIESGRNTQNAMCPTAAGERYNITKQKSHTSAEKLSPSRAAASMNGKSHAPTAHPTSRGGSQHCGCHLAGCQRCYPGDYHAAHCGLSSCEDCADLGPGYDLWHACQTAPDADIFTEGDSVLSRTFNGQKNVLSLVVARELLNAMRNAVTEGRRYRRTKKQIDVELDAINEEARPTWQVYIRAIAEVKQVKKDLRLARLPHCDEQIRLKAVKDYRKRAQNNYRAFKTRERRLKSRLRDAEHIWWTSLWDLDHYHRLILEDAGVVSDDDERDWNAADYRIHHRIRSRYYGDSDVYNGEDTNTDSSCGAVSPESEPNEMPAQAPRTYEEELADIKDEWVQHLAGLEAKVQSARQMHDDARGTHGPLLDFYCRDNPDRDPEELKDEYGPQFVQLTRKYATMLQDAEDKLEARRAAARAAGIDPYAENAFDLGGDERYLERLVAENAEKLIANVDRRKISRWLDSFREYEPWPVLELDSDGGFGSETSSIASDSSTGSSNPAGSKLCDREGSRLPQHSRKRNKFMVGDANLDSISVFNDDDYIRRHIDSWANEKRGGYL